MRSGETVAILHTADAERLSRALPTFQAALTFQENEPEPEPLLFARVAARGVERFA